MLLRYSFLIFLCVLLVGCSRSLKQQGQGDERPNIIIIMADDLGYSDVGCYGGEINTPAIDALAKNGIRFSSFYNNARCCPTRASLLTGLYPHTAGVGAMTHDNKSPGYRGYLTENTATIAELLKDAGYRTGMVGKWHVSQTAPLPKEEQLKWLAHQEDRKFFSPIEQYPTRRGFEKYFGNVWGVVDFFDPFSLVDGTEPVLSVPEDYYHTNAIGDSAVAYVEEFVRDEKPFFLYVAHTAPHWPLHALEEDIMKYENTYKVGWQVIRDARYRRLIDLGIFEEGKAALPPWMYPEKKWEQNADTAFDARAMAVHAAMVERMDKTIGNLLQKLEEENELDNTVIFFLSDNGASPERPSKYGPGFDRPGSTRDGAPITYPVDKQSMPGGQHVFSGIGPEWASVSNTPFRYFKARLFEGGMATPFIVHWPAKITKRGSISRHTAHVTDVMATCLEIADVKYPDTFQGRAITPTPGISFLGAILNQEQPKHEVLFWEHLGAAALREGDWKLVKLKEDSPWELYNVSMDQTETQNLAKEHPEVLQRMVQTWERMAHEQKVFPGPSGH